MEVKSSEIHGRGKGTSEYTKCSEPMCAHGKENTLGRYYVRVWTPCVSQRLPFGWQLSSSTCSFRWAHTYVHVGCIMPGSFFFFSLFSFSCASIPLQGPIAWNVRAKGARDGSCRGGGYLTHIYTTLCEVLVSIEVSTACAQSPHGS